MATKTRAKTDFLQPGGELELMGLAEVAEALGTTTGNVPRMLLNPVNPMPGPAVDYLKCGKLWLRSDIEEFAAEREARRLMRGGPG